VGAGVQGVAAGIGKDRGAARSGHQRGGRRDVGVQPGYGGDSVGGFGSLNGTRANQMNWQIDGVDNNDFWHNIPAVNQGGVSGIAGVIMPLDAVDEFASQTQSNAEGGRNAGGIVNVVLKSGTNQLHGSLYYYNRNTALGAASPFFNASALKAAGLPDKKPPLRNENFGFSLGGPIIKDKLWFYGGARAWGSIEDIAGVYFNQPANQAALAPSVIAAGGFKTYAADLTRPAFYDRYTRDGAFSLNSQGMLYDPASGLAVQGYMANASGKVTQSGTPGNITIPIGLAEQATATGTGVKTGPTTNDQVFDMSMGGNLDQTQWAQQFQNQIGASVSAGTPDTISTTRSAGPCSRAGCSRARCSFVERNGHDARQVGAGCAVAGGAVLRCKPGGRGADANDGRGGRGRSGGRRAGRGRGARHGAAPRGGGGGGGAWLDNWGRAARGRGS